MFTEKRLAIIGVFLLVIGMFLPAWHDETDDSSPNFVEINPEDDITADGPGVYILIVAAAALLLLVMDRPEYTWATTLLAFLPLFLYFASFWASTLNDTGTTLGIGWSAILGGLILMSAPFWAESLKSYLGWLETEGDVLEENLQEEGA